MTSVDNAHNHSFMHQQFQAIEETRHENMTSADDALSQRVYYPPTPPPPLKKKSSGKKAPIRAIEDTRTS